MTEPSGDEPIVITREELTSGHVDDLLRRQMALRGETVFGAEAKRRWYYQNWILFAVVGLVAAIAAWALLEPSFEDYFHIQGKIESMKLDDQLAPEGAHSSDDDEREVYGQGWITIRGQKIWFAPGIRETHGSHVQGFYDPSGLAVGREVGVHAKYFESGGAEIGVAHFIDPSPPIGASGKVLTPLREQHRSHETAAMLMFATVAALIGLGIGATDGIVCRIPQRAIIGGLVGALVGFVGGLLSGVVASVIYAPLSHAAQNQLSSSSGAVRSIGFLLQMVARMMAWTLAGAAMGLGQGFALRSSKLMSYGFLGGIIGGMLGGLLFDPLDVVLGAGRIGADSSRLIGFAVIGAAVGTMIGIVELLTRDAWLRMIEGPLAGKEFLMFRDVMNIGASPKSEIYLFNDSKVAQTHATIRMVGDECEISARDRVNPLLVNGQSVRTSRLRHGDRIQIGDTSFLFEQRQRA
ncbi:MAG: FHA domain-containing protein [Thermoanaerobaculia bacterium]